ncbi:MAG: cold shock domain-containing protein, partial [Chloroflexota bacterium]
MAREQGIIETWKESEGFGFIQPDGGGKDYFFHKSAVQNNKKPAEGQKVTFTVGRDAKGRLRAENVTIGKNATKIEQVRGQTKGRIGLPDLGSRG